MVKSEISDSKIISKIWSGNVIVLIFLLCTGFLSSDWATEDQIWQFFSRKKSSYSSNNGVWIKITNLNMAPSGETDLQVIYKWYTLCITHQFTMLCMCN